MLQTDNIFMRESVLMRGVSCEVELITPLLSFIDEYSHESLTPVLTQTNKWGWNAR